MAADWQEENRRRFSTRSLVRFGPQTPHSEACGDSESCRLPLSQDVEQPSTNARHRATSFDGLRDVLTSHGSTPSARLLMKEHTYIQYKENKLGEANSIFVAVKELPRNFPGRKEHILRSLHAVNQTLYDYGSHDEQLGIALLSGCVAVEESVGWKNFKRGSLTPTRALQSLRMQRREDRLEITTGLWAGKTVTVADLQALREKKDVFYEIVPVYLTYLSEMLYLLDGVHSNLDKQERLCRLFSEYWTVNEILTYHEYQDVMESEYANLPENHTIPSASWVEIMRMINLSHHQLQRCKDLRDWHRKKHTDWSDGMKCMNDIVEEMMERDGADLHMSRGLLAAADAIRVNNLNMLQAQTELACSFLFGELDPLQTALLISHLATTSPHPIASKKDWVKILNRCLTSKDESEWMEAYLPRTDYGWHNMQDFLDPPLMISLPVDEVYRPCSGQLVP